MVDLSNAHNKYERNFAFQALRDFFPEASPLFEAFYSVQATLYYGDAKIKSCKGAHQGDPCAGLGCCATLHPIIKHISDEVPQLKGNLWFQDYGTLIGRKEHRLLALQILLVDGPPRGLHLNASKTTIWCPGTPSSVTHPLTPDIKRAPDEGIIVLGTPIGEPGYICEYVASKIDIIQTTLDLLPSLDDPHSHLVLLKSCFSWPRITFLTRTVPSSLIKNQLRRFDYLVQSSLEVVLGAPLSPSQRQQVTLPISQGGIGLRSTVLHAAPAYIASVAHSMDLVHTITGLPLLAETGPVSPLFKHFQDSIDSLNTSISDAERLEPSEAAITKQKQTSFQIDTKISDSLLEQADTSRDKARLRALRLKGAGQWLHSVPNIAMGLHLYP